MRSCNVCQRESPDEACEHAQVRCNVRKFRDERFEVWRCPACRTIHAAQPVDLAHYYSAYPSLKEEVQWRLDPMYKSMLKRLTAAGLQHSHRILDYGCGSGALVRYLRRQGYAQTSGYDAYSAGVQRRGGAVRALRLRDLARRDRARRLAARAARRVRSARRSHRR